MSTKEKPGPFDGLERAQPGEPVFTLRAHDDLAAPLVREWVERRRAVILAAKLTDEKRTIELVQAREAGAIAEDMEAWRMRDHVVPEAPEAARYSGVVDTEADLLAKDRHDTLRRVVDRLHNSVAEIADAADALSRIADDSPADPLWFVVGELCRLSNAVKAQAFAIEPKRGGR